MTFSARHAPESRMNHLLSSTSLETADFHQETAAQMERVIAQVEALLDRSNAHSVLAGQAANDNSAPVSYKKAV